MMEPEKQKVLIRNVTGEPTSKKGHKKQPQNFFSTLSSYKILCAKSEKLIQDTLDKFSTPGMSRKSSVIFVQLHNECELPAA